MQNSPLAEAPSIEDDVKHILKMIPLAGRRIVSGSIDRVCAALSVPNTYICDQRSKAYEDRVDPKIRAKRLNLHKYWIGGRDSMDDEPFTLEAAAKFMGVTEKSLQVRVSSKKEFSKFFIPLQEGRFGSSHYREDIYTCRKMTAWESESHYQWMSQQNQISTK